MPALAFGMTQFVLIPQIQKGLGAKTATASETGGKLKKDDPNAKKTSVTMNKLLVNVAGTMGARYLLVSISVVGTGADFKQPRCRRTTLHLRDMAGSTLPPRRSPIWKSPARGT